MRDGIDVRGGRRTPHAPERVTAPAAGESQSGRFAGAADAGRCLGPTRFDPSAKCGQADSFEAWMPDRTSDEPVSRRHASDAR